MVSGYRLLTAPGLEPTQVLKEAKSPVQVSFFSSKGGSKLAQRPYETLQGLSLEGERKVFASPGLSFVGEYIQKKTWSLEISILSSVLPSLISVTLRNRLQLFGPNLLIKKKKKGGSMFGPG